MSGWVRLWHDMPTDPKWRVIARKSGQPLACVVALFSYMLVEASRSKDKGSIEGVRPEEAAEALDLDQTAIEAILGAMKGRVTDGRRLISWDRRQPKREDLSTERAARHRERKRNATQGNADANGASDAPIDAKKKLFEAGIPLLMNSNKTRDAAAAMLGKWRKQYGDGAVIDALAVAQSEAASDPIPFITRILETRNGNRPRSTDRPAGPIESRRRFHQQHDLDAQ
ncbi:hypothetical protein [Sphingomonas azotifigens]|uniref:hypothetical protein n=1 Tax=Sphingomonas azotifigens TaxID=330920 RepID=UPI001C3FC6A2|nr:hypothetical protein [Sphingomonas azotifigens]